MSGAEDPGHRDQPPPPAARSAVPRQLGPAARARQFDATLVRVTTDDGLVGCGSGDAMLGFAGHEPLFVGQDPMAIERHYRVLSNLDFHYGRCWPLDLALWDLIGKITGQPCWKLLGGASTGASAPTPRPACCASRRRWPTRPSGSRPRASRRMKIRFRRGDWRDDIRALEAVRARLGDELELMVDCNQGWRMPWDTEPPWTLKDALPVARELERLGVYWMEEPLRPRRLRRHAGAARGGGYPHRRRRDDPRALARSATCAARRLPRRAAAGRALVGGITGLRRVAHLAEAHGLIFTPHTWTNGMGVVANAHLVAGLGCAPFLEFPYDPPQWSLERRDFPMAGAVRGDGRLDHPHRCARNGLSGRRRSARPHADRVTTAAAAGGAQLARLRPEDRTAGRAAGAGAGAAAAVVAAGVGAAGRRAVGYRVRVARAPRRWPPAAPTSGTSGRVASDACFDIAYAGAPLGVAAALLVDGRGLGRDRRAGRPAPVASWWEMGLLDAGRLGRRVAGGRDGGGPRRPRGGAALDLERGRAAGRPAPLPADVPAARPPAEATLFVGARGRLRRARPGWRAGRARGGQPARVRRPGRAAAGARRAGGRARTCWPPRAPPRPTRAIRGRGSGAFAALVKLRARGRRACCRIVTGRDWRDQRRTGDPAWTAATPAAHPPRAGLAADRRHAAAQASSRPPSPVVSARLYATALGAYEAFLNGAAGRRRAAGAREHRLPPARALPRLRRHRRWCGPARNVLGAHVGDGWYASYVAPGGRYAFGPPPRRFLAQLELTFADGSRADGGDRRRLAHARPPRSSPRRSTTARPRTRAASSRAGARPGSTHRGWDEARVDDGAALASSAAQAAPPIRVDPDAEAPRRSPSRGRASSCSTSARTSPALPRLRVKGAPASAVDAALRRDPAGRAAQVDQANLRAAKATRHLRAEGRSGRRDLRAALHLPRLPLRAGRGLSRGRRARPTSRASSSTPTCRSPATLRIDSPLVEQVWRTRVWSQRSNFTGIPTDCPQRDERLGWLGDANVFWDAAAFNMDVYGFTQPLRRRHARRPDPERRPSPTTRRPRAGSATSRRPAGPTPASCCPGPPGGVTARRRSSTRTGRRWRATSLPGGTPTRRTLAPQPRPRLRRLAGARRQAARRSDHAEGPGRHGLVGATRALAAEMAARDRPRRRGGLA